MMQFFSEIESVSGFNNIAFPGANFGSKTELFPYSAGFYLLKSPILANSQKTSHTRSRRKVLEIKTCFFHIKGQDWSQNTPWIQCPTFQCDHLHSYVSEALLLQWQQWGRSKMPDWESRKRIHPHPNHCKKGSHGMTWSKDFFRLRNFRYTNHIAESRITVESSNSEVK